MTSYGPPLHDRLQQQPPPYRSRGEAKVARLLNEYGIPFLYEHPTTVYDRGRHRVWHPDFTLPTYHGMIVEYAGMPDLPDYMAGIRHKRKVYRANGIPAVFIYPGDIAMDRSPQRVLDRIVDAARAYRPATQYQATSAAQPASSRPRPSPRARGCRR